MIGVWSISRDELANVPAHDLHFYQIEQQVNEINPRYIELITKAARKLKNNLKKTIHEIAAFIDEPIGDSLIPLMQITEQQGNIINDEWKKRFIANIKREKGTISEEFADLTIKFRNRIRKIID